VALPASADGRGALAPMLLSAGQQSIDISCPPGVQQQTHAKATIAQTQPAPQCRLYHCCVGCA